jgi:hypothetical protein
MNEEVDEDWGWIDWLLLTTTTTTTTMMMMMVPCVILLRWREFVGVVGIVSF